MVIYLGYDSESAKLRKSVSIYRDLFDEVRMIYVPETDPETLSKLSIPSLSVEEVPA